MLIFAFEANSMALFFGFQLTVTSPKFPIEKRSSGSQLLYYSLKRSLPNQPFKSSRYGAHILQDHQLACTRYVTKVDMLIKISSWPLHLLKFRGWWCGSLYWDIFLTKHFFKKIFIRRPRGPHHHDLLVFWTIWFLDLLSKGAP